MNNYITISVNAITEAIVESLDHEDLADSIAEKYADRYKLDTTAVVEALLKDERFVDQVVEALTDGIAVERIQARTVDILAEEVRRNTNFVDCVAETVAEHHKFTAEELVNAVKKCEPLMASQPANPVPDDKDRQVYEPLMLTLADTDELLNLVREEEMKLFENYGLAANDNPMVRLKKEIIEVKRKLINRFGYSSTE